MVKSVYYYISKSYCPYHNLALEELLAKSLKKDQAVLYLWQNADTVVIGKHQNAYSECNYETMKKENISLARRKTGGGAVFHDDKNLNFTFISRKEDYDLKKNQSIICKAVQSFGLTCEISGRNDITYEGRKFSGNAFFNGKDYCIHHGTIMLDVDLTRLERYLTVDKAKLLRKGVASVRARVVNLKSVAPQITIDGMRKALIDAFEEEYNMKANSYDITLLKEEFDKLINFYASEEFLMGNYPIIVSRERKDYGELMLTKIKDKYVVFSDCLDVDIIDYINKHLSKNKKSIPTTEDLNEQKHLIISDINKMLLQEESS